MTEQVKIFPNDYHLPNLAAAVLLLLYGTGDWPFQYLRQPLLLYGGITIGDSSATNYRQRWRGRERR
jgi:hypothetical protein